MLWQQNFFNVLVTLCQQWRQVHSIYQKVTWSESILQVCFTSFLGFINYVLWKIHAVHALQVEIGELKGRLTEVISNCDALCKRIAAEGPDSLQASIKPLAVTTTRSEVSCSSSSLQKDDKLESSSTEGKRDWLFAFSV